MSATLVIQSAADPEIGGWRGECLASVRHWADANQFHYRFVDDALFECIAPDLLRRTIDQPVIATDLARLVLLKQALGEGFERVVWLDADTLVLDSAAFTLPAELFAVGREHWVQSSQRGLRCYRKVHNAFLMFTADNPFLAFYRYSAEAIVRAHTGAHMVPQLVGPKLLTAWHNISPLPVCEAVDVFSPEVIRDLNAGGGAALDLWSRQRETDAAAVNLAASSVARGEVSDTEMEALIAHFRRRR